MTSLNGPSADLKCAYYIGLIQSLGLNATKNTHHMGKKTLNKRCSELNFVQKSPREHMFISPQSGASGLERLICLKYYYEGKW